jgi:hypothetical protein
VLKQLSGKIKHQRRRFYRYCSKCTIFLKGLVRCVCCGLQLRKKIGYDRRRKYEEKNRDKRRLRNNKNREKYLAYQRAYYHSHKK